MTALAQDLLQLEYRGSHDWKVAAPAKVAEK